MPDTPLTVPSTDGVQIAAFDLGGSGYPLLISHATGFHGRCYIPLAYALAESAHNVAFDYRGHGDTPRPEGPVDWQRYADDAEAMGVWLTEREGGPIDGFGHSMGGTCLLIAALRRPTLFRRLVLFEPIVFPPRERAPGEVNPLEAGARKRRRTFHTYEAAYENYSAKPPLNGFTPEALHAYVDYGFARDRHGVHLKCHPDTEADTFSQAGGHDTWQHLSEIDIEVLVISGHVTENGPASIAEQVADRLPNGRYLLLDHMDHFGPMTHPTELAATMS